MNKQKKGLFVGWDGVGADLHCRCGSCLFPSENAASVFPWSKATPLLAAQVMNTAAASDSFAATASSSAPPAHRPMSSTKRIGPGRQAPLLPPLEKKTQKVLKEYRFGGEVQFQHISHSYASPLLHNRVLNKTVNHKRQF